MRRVVIASALALLALAVDQTSAAIGRGSARRASVFKHHAAHVEATNENRGLMGPTSSSLIDIWVNDTISTNGWIGMRIRKSNNASNIPHDHGAVWYAAGYAEGTELSERIRQHWVNTVKPTPESVLAPEVQNWIVDHIAFVQERVAMLNSTDPFWKFVGLHLQQLQGLTDGYNAAPIGQQNPMSFFDMFVFNFQYELGDVATATSASEPEHSYLYAKGGCTAIVKPLDGDLTFSHTTWNTYRSMLRVYRDIDLGDLRIAYSGYPGLIASGDDWYMLSNNLTVVETTNLIWKSEIYKEFTVPQTVSEWIRVMVANHIGFDGVSWVNAFRRYNSGTYNNQYMVLNNNLYDPSMTAADLADNTLWIVEQIPGMAPAADVTEHIRTWGYWGSYNRPYFEEVYNASGNLEMEKIYGDFFSHNKYVRAKLLARANPGLHTIEDVKTLMRYNEWQTDPLSVCPGCKNPDRNPYFAVASRGDLVPHGPNVSYGLLGPVGTMSPTNAFGAIDAKLFSWQRFMANFSGLIISGPTHQTQEPFRWSTSWVEANLPKTHTSHIGQADLQEWDWVDTLDVVPNV